MPETKLIELKKVDKLYIFIIDLELTILPFHLLGLKGLIGVTANLPEFRDRIFPLAE